jgi:hypothetical protein
MMAFMASRFTIRRPGGYGCFFNAQDVNNYQLILIHLLALDRHFILRKY